MSSTADERDALATTLAAEHAAVWLYGLLGARVSASAEPVLHAGLVAAYAAHRGRRDLLVALVRDDGDVPVAAAPSYVEPGPLDDVAQVRAAAQEAEAASAVTWGALVASTSGERRRTALAGLRDAAVRHVAFGGSPSTTAEGPAAPA
ncbi:DUF4439 domain-containing protein [Nocardioides sp. ChNu-153]|uniref:DUF4439 domain-containing protein n=1 Tax=unclassified Nocardioides TaxID=2615069 RepID=UPI0024054C8E|nr:MULTISPECIES: DUF4439 domain-containing protein [unclassified Nocardioides]MDF9717768.1 ferritin-like domain-containing protein [Nocardioides sp. ChNu-99]MDN7122588.1 DUF4439 domain-containing protein [Nocardioides sp. ChNu-153]